MANGKLRVAIYIRVSTLDQAREGYSLAAQEKTLRDYCKAYHYEIYDLYADEGYSGKDIKHRDGMLRLLADAQERKFDIILVWKLTRFSRRLSDLTKTCEDLEANGIYLVSYTEAFDSKTPAGRMLRGVLGTVAQFEREVISENVSLGMAERARQGKPTCSSVLGYDKSDKDTYIINELEAEYVRFTFDTYLLTRNLIKTAELAREHGYKGKRGKPPTPYSVNVILTRPLYVGYNTFKGSIYKGNHPLIISIDKYNSVQKILKKQGKYTGRDRKTQILLLP